MPVANVNHARLNYRLDGAEDAPVLLLSNSLGTDLRMWEPQMPALTEKFRVLRYDSRGHGSSEATPGPYSIDQLGRDAAGLLDALGIPRAHFCGLSMGGMVGMWLGVNAPARIDKLVLCNTAARIAPPELWNVRIQAVRQGGMSAISEGVLNRWFTLSFLESSPAAVGPMRQTLLATDPEGYAAACAAVRDMDQREDIARIAAPTLVIAGAFDAATPPQDGRFLAERIAGAKYVELQAAHLSNIEAADRFTEALMSFLTE